MDASEDESCHLVPASVKTNRLKTRGALRASKRWITVEPVVMTAAFGYGILQTVLAQYFHYHFTHAYANSSLKNFSICEANVSSHMKDINNEVQAQTSLWMTYCNTCIAITCLPVSTLLGSLSDQIGRKIPMVLPLVGIFLCSCCSALVIHYKLHLSRVLIGVTLLGLSGGFILLVTVSYAYAADITTEEKRMFRIVVLEVLVFLMAGFPQIAVGYIITHLGFEVPFIVSGAMSLIGLIYALIPGCLLETVEVNGIKPKQHTKAAVKEIIQVFKVTDNNRHWIVILYLVAIFITIGCGVGSIPVTSIYAMGQPFCLSPEEIGFFIFAILISTGLGCMIGGAVLPLCVGSFTMMYISFFNAQVGFVAIALVEKKSWLYVAVCVSFLKLLAAPVSRTALSTIVTPSEQGTIFALISVMENVATFVFPIFLQAIYTTTITYHQFVFYLAAGIVVIPVVATMIIQTLKQRSPPIRKPCVDPSSTQSVAM